MPNTEATNPKDMADLLGYTFAENSSSKNYTDEFKSFKDETEKQQTSHPQTKKYTTKQSH